MVSFVTDKDGNTLSDEDLKKMNVGSLISLLCGYVKKMKFCSDKDKKMLEYLSNSLYNNLHGNRTLIGHMKPDLADEITCPHCKVVGEGLIVEDYTNMHYREALIECGVCDKLYKIYYKFDKIVKLNEDKHES